MSTITISNLILPNYQYAGSTATVRIYANQDFLTSDDQVIQQGSIHERTFYKEVACTVASNILTAASFTLESTTDSNNQRATYTAVLYDADDRQRDILLANFRLVHTLGSTMNWSQVIQTNAVTHRPYSTYYSSEAIEAMINGLQPRDLDLTTIAALTPANNDVIQRKAGAWANRTMEQLAEDLNPFINALQDGDKNEVNVDDDGTNWTVIEPTLKRVKEAWFLAGEEGFDYAALKTTASGDSSTDYYLKVDTSISETASNTHPDNLYLDFSYGGVLNVASGQTVNINPPVNPPPGKRIFTGAGQVNLKEHSGAGHIKAEWWLPPAITGNQTITAAMRLGIQTSQENNYHSLVEFPNGDFSLDTSFETTHGRWKGQGADANCTTGTRIRLTANDSSAFTILPGARNVVIEDIGSYTVDDSVTGVKHVLITGELPGDASVNTIEFKNFRTYNGERGISMERIGSGNYLFDNVIIHQNCSFTAYTDCGIYCDSLNTSITVLSETFAGRGNGTSIQCKMMRCGGFTAVGQGRGPQSHTIIPDAPECVTIELDPSDFNTTTNQITATAHGLPTGTTCRMRVLPDEDDADLPTATDYTFADERKFWVNAVDANTLTFHKMPEQARTGSSAIDITAQPADTVTLYTNVINPTIAAAQPYACFYFGSQIAGSGVNVSHWQDEGCQYSVVFEDNESIGRDHPVCYASPFVFSHCLFQGFTLFKRGANVTFIGCSLPVESIKDEYDVKAYVSLTGVRWLTSGPTSNYVPYTRSGYKIHNSPWNSTDFIGQSQVLLDVNQERGNTVERYGNNVPIVRFRSNNYASEFGFDQWLERIDASTTYPNLDDYPGAFVWMNSQDPNIAVDGGSNAQNVQGMMSHLLTNGWVQNLKTAQAAGWDGSNLPLDLSKGNLFSGTISGNANLTVTNGPANAWMKVYFLHTTSGTTSYTISGNPSGTPPVFMDDFATGTSSGVRKVLEFIWDGTRLVETRNADTTPVTYSTGARLTTDTTTNTDTSLNDRLTVTLPTTGLWEVTAQVYVSDAGSGGYKTAFGGTATYSAARFNGTTELLDGSATAAFHAASWTDPTSAKTWTVSSTARLLKITGVYQVTGAGTIIFQSAQNASDAGDITEYAGSYIKAVKLS